MIRVSFYGSLFMVAMSASTVSALKFQEDNILSQMENYAETDADLDLDLDTDTMSDTINENELYADIDAEWGLSSLGNLIKKGASGLAGGVSRGFTAAKNWITGTKPTPKKKEAVAKKKAVNANKAALAKK